MRTRKFRVVHEDGRSTLVNAPDVAHAKRQANHQETTRVLIATRRGLPVRMPPSMAIDAVCLETESG